MECYIINPALSLLVKHLVIGQRQKAPNFSAFHWNIEKSEIFRYEPSTRGVVMCLLVVSITFLL